MIIPALVDIQGPTSTAGDNRMCNTDAVVEACSSFCGVHTTTAPSGGFYDILDAMGSIATIAAFLLACWVYWWQIQENKVKRTRKRRLQPQRASCNQDNRMGEQSDGPAMNMPSPGDMMSEKILWQLQKQKISEPE